MTGLVSPYIVPGQLTQFPLGVSWQSIPTNSASAAVKYAAQVNICTQATAMADAKANQVLRATTQTEQLFGPGGYRVNSLQSGNTRLLLSQWPILSVSAIQCARRFTKSVGLGGNGQFSRLSALDTLADTNGEPWRS